jgi:hypothetical protein
VGPFVPQPWRAAPVTASVPGATRQETVTSTPPAGTALEAGMAVPASIPPYRPLRPTPIVSPAMRTPLYIPPIPTPAAEAVIEEEGTFEPVLVDTAEFAIPSVQPRTEPAADLDDVVVPVASATPEVVVAVSPAPPAASVAPTPVHELPWIDAFLASTPPLPMAAIPTPMESVPTVEEFLRDEPFTEEAEAALPTSASAFVEGTRAEYQEETELEAAAFVEADDWPLDEAAAEFEALRTQLSADAAHTTAPHDGVVSGLSPWSDDDLMDIMPIVHSGHTPLSSAAVPADGELWADRARKAHEEAQVFRAMASSKDAEVREPRNEPSSNEATPEESAHALELLARRVRAGELTLPSYDPRMGEPAALVAALAALLGVRLR